MRRRDLSTVTIVDAERRMVIALGKMTARQGDIFLSVRFDDASYEELAARQPAKFAAMLPGNPKPEDYVLANFSPYRVHQRLAEKMRVGRFLLAADSAHLCNPL